MARGPLPSAFSESDLNGLVDGRLEPGRETELIHRLKAYPLDRARIEAWREQNDLIKATFSEVESETIPVSLSLSPPPRLRCVASDGRATVSSPVKTAIAKPVAFNGGNPKPGLKDPDRPPAAPFATQRLAPSRSEPDPTTRRWGRARSMTLGAVIGCLAMLGFWTMHDRPPLVPVTAASQGDRGLDRAPAPIVDSHFGEEALAARTLEALDRARRTNDGSDGSSNEGRPLARDLPTLAIPDLAAEGWSFTGATLQASLPTALIFFYQNEDAERLVISVSDAPWSTSSRPRRVGRTVTWRHNSKVFVLGGTVDMRRLDTLASALQTERDTMRASP